MANLPDFFGIDFGGASIKFTEIRGKDKKLKVEKLAHFDVEKELLTNESEQGIKLLADNIKHFHKESKIGTKNCILAIPEVEVFSRLITLPKITDAEVDEAIHWAIKPLLPGDIESMNISYLEVSTIGTGDKEQVNWYVVAASKTLIKKYQDIFKLADLNLLAVETETLSLSRFINTNYPNQGDIIILDLGSDSSNIVISRNGSVIFSQTIGTGSNSITQAIASDFGIEERQAEQYKYSYGIDFEQAEGKVAKSVQGVVDLILDEVGRTVSYARDKIEGDKIAKIFVTGGGSMLPKLSTYMQSKLQIETIITNPFQSIELAKKASESVNNTLHSRFNVSIGLALKGKV